MSADRPTSPSAILCSMPADGHVAPMLAIGRGLAERGWRIRFLTGEAYADRVRAAGLEFAPLPPEAVTLDEVAAGERPKGAAAINDGVTRAFLDPAPHAGRALLALLDEEPADAVLFELTFVGAVVLEALPDATRPLRVMCGIGPLGLSSRATPPYGLGALPMAGPLGTLRNALMKQVATRLVLRPVHQRVEALLAEVGAAPLDGGFFFDIVTRADLLVQLTVPEFEYPRPDAPDHLHFVGPVSRTTPSSLPVPEWWDRLSAGAPVVHVSQGTVAVSDFDELVGPTLKGLADEDVLVVVSTGNAALDLLPPLPANAVAAEFLPYDRLFPLTSVFVTNGGYGGLHYAMEHGTPIVVAGDTEDKVETSARVAWSRAGVRLKTGRPTPEQVRRAVRRLLDDPSYASRSAAIGAAIRRSPGVPGLVDLVEARLLLSR
ncbi:glycosyltransferase [Nocardioides lianchengensis]|uniref:UDP:flavonoid glycosyltransferase YjiC, YdhE family n=1 Tax=Nocardioides lianchengensis TaxID=1045774 RepID=A0A1G6RJM1_9ACTN|nr:nucleotide disphospho-sugar-binding domain-containing protein [Nocardioides lianchengensis]NYG10229.1 UDP:flavonoid glycosyltransferase YjiC (YdhE family) [Nocardioides lianchengensis]SDD04177.1 UDP:flavonoid glycosyltransferase YjiC, YdhE family [Nocardioides lianchengensis]